jgi:hypothetical protein
VTAAKVKVVLLSNERYVPACLLQVLHFSTVLSFKSLIVEDRVGGKLSVQRVIKMTSRIAPS